MFEGNKINVYGSLRSAINRKSHGSLCAILSINCCFAKVERFNFFLVLMRQRSNFQIMYDASAIFLLAFPLVICANLVAAVAIRKWIPRKNLDTGSIMDVLNILMSKYNFWKLRFGSKCVGKRTNSTSSLKSLTFFKLSKFHKPSCFARIG